MVLDPQFREVGSFDAADPLGRQIGQLEENASRAFATVGERSLAKLRPTETKTAAYTASLGDLVVTSGTLTVTLPVATPKNAGEEVGVLRQSGTITVMAPTGLVQGAATDSLGTSGVYRYV